MWICDIFEAACLSKRGVADWLGMFQTDRKRTMDLPTLGAITLSLIWRTLHKSGMPWTRTAIRPFIPCQWNWILPSALYVQLYGIFYITVWVPSGSKSSDMPHKEQFCWNVCRCTILSMMHFYSRLCQAARHSVTNQQAHIRDTSLHLTQGNSSWSIGW